MGYVAPKSIVVEVADLISLWGRQNRKGRDGEALVMLPGLYRRHAFKEHRVNKGGPAGSGGACRV